MGRKEHQDKVNGIIRLIDMVASELDQNSDCLSEVEQAAHLGRLEKLREAAAKMSEKLTGAAPFAVEPFPGFHQLCEKLRGYVIKEYIAAMRLTHQKLLAFEKAVTDYEQAVKQEGHEFDLEAAKAKMKSVSQAFRQLGSKKLYEQGNAAIEKAITDCEQVLAETESLFAKALEDLQALLPAQ